MNIILWQKQDFWNKFILHDKNDSFRNEICIHHKKTTFFTTLYVNCVFMAKNHI